MLRYVHPLVYVTVHTIMFCRTEYINTGIKIADLIKVTVVDTHNQFLNEY